MSNQRRLPTVRDYLDWAVSQGCTVDITPAGNGVQMALLTQPNGLYVFEFFAEDIDELASSNVARLDRRLGLKSYLFT